MVKKTIKTQSKKAITGLYIFDKNVSKLSSKLKKSKSELEIIDLLNCILKIKKLILKI